MTTPHKAMLIQARDALLSACGGRCNAEYNPCEAREVADALTAAIDAPEPEPVAHIRQTYIVGLDGELLGVSEKKELRFGCGNDYAHCTPLYTRPPAVREPLTEAEIIKIAQDNLAADPGRDGYILPIKFARAIEAALRAKS